MSASSAFCTVIGCFSDGLEETDFKSHSLWSFGSSFFAYIVLWSPWHIWQLCFAFWESMPLVALMELDCPSLLCGSTCCKREPLSLHFLSLARARFNPILNTLMFRRRRSPGTQRASNAHGEVFDAESVVSGDSVCDIRQETKGTGEGLAL
ncbi:hypothetical protein JB92DRAFT_778455 [Gautieria morchelliformis]|nr:hypothetical protein JB92DRAFT_778455 [Gautieria morchelliformis]